MNIQGYSRDVESKVEKWRTKIRNKGRRNESILGQSGGKTQGKKRVKAEEKRMNFVSTRERWMHLNFSRNKRNRKQPKFCKRSSTYFTGGRKDLEKQLATNKTLADHNVDKGEERKRGMNNRVTRIRSQSS